VSKSEPKRRVNVHFAWACVGSHGGIFVTSSTPHAPSVGRYEIYETYELALKNAVGNESVVAVKITEVGPRGERIRRGK
jgi:hypothetical protein